MADNLESVMSGGESRIDKMLLYQPSDGMLEMKKVGNKCTCIILAECNFGFLVQNYLEHSVRYID